MALSLGIDRHVDRGEDVIDLRVPADPAYLAVIRTAMVGVATRLDLTLDEIEDLRIAVDEACALLIDQHHQPDSWLHALFRVDVDTDQRGREGRLDVRITGPRSDRPLQEGHPWMLLRALVDEVSSGMDATGRWIALTHRSDSTGPTGSGAGEAARA
ncbi:ATP-binding protein [Spongisporangium articulatum]|uniref:ATP-binding protein n=1 Tax=Spongisporangium articulatum TaxID=3362603 RepID=A0ABW8AJZ8_9ACTN